MPESFRGKRSNTFAAKSLSGSMPFPVEIDFSTNMTIGGTTARH